MKMYDSLKTMNRCHEYMKLLSEYQQRVYAQELRNLFDVKQVSEEGAYATYLITEKDVEEIYNKLFKKD